MQTFVKEITKEKPVNTKKNMKIGGNEKKNEMCRILYTCITVHQVQSITKHTK